MGLMNMISSGLQGGGMGALAGGALGLVTAGPYGAINGALMGGQLGGQLGGITGLLSPDHGAMMGAYNPAMMGPPGNMQPFGGFNMPSGLLGGIGGAALGLGLASAVGSLFAPPMYGFGCGGLGGFGGWGGGMDMNWMTPW